MQKLTFITYEYESGASRKPPSKLSLTLLLTITTDKLMFELQI